MKPVGRYTAVWTAIVTGALLAAGGAAAKPPPKPMLVPPLPSDPSNQPTASFAFTDSKPGVLFECRLDGPPFLPCISGQTYSGLADGTHTFHVRAVNTDGPSDDATFTWTIDLHSPPAPSITAKPPNPSNESSPSFSFSDSEGGVTFGCRLDAESFAPCSSPKPYTGLPGGNHTFRVRAVDRAGNQSGVTEYTWTIDLQSPPAPSIAAKPPNPSNESSPSFSFSDSKGGVTFRCKLDSEPFGPCSSPKTYTGLSGGDHTFGVRAVAQGGNQSDVTEYTWTIDLTAPPAPTISGSPANPTTATTATFAFADSEAGVAFRCELDGGDLSSCTSPVAYSGLMTIPHVFSVRAVDPAGNVGGPASFGWSIIPSTDTSAPGDVSGVRRSLGYRTIKLVWSRPRDADFDHVRVLIATVQKGAKSVPRKVVYTGSGTQYIDKRFRNDVYHRYRILSYDHTGNQSSGVDVVAPPSGLLRSPAAGAVLRAAPRLVWTGVAGARFYNAQLYFRGRKVLSAWPTHPRLGLKRRWSYSGRSFRLKKGTYTWYVWPGFGSRAKVQYGQLLGLSSFTVR